MNINKNDTAVVVIDPQNDVLSETGVSSEYRNTEKRSLRLPLSNTTDEIEGITSQALDHSSLLHHSTSPISNLNSDLDRRASLINPALMSKQFDVNDFSLISSTTLWKTMKMLLKRAALLLAIPSYTNQCLRYFFLKSLC